MKNSRVDYESDLARCGGPLPDIAMACVGCIVPDEPAFHNPAFSRASQMSQEGLLTGLAQAGLTPSIVLSLRMIPSFPSSRRLWVGKEETRLRNGIRINLLPFFNLTPVKQITIGLGTLWALLVWGWRTRKLRHRLVYAWNLSVPPAIFTLLGARLIGAKAFVWVCDIDIPGQTVPNSLAYRITFAFSRWLIPCFDGHIVLADRIMQDFAPGRPYYRLDGGITRAILDRTGDDFKPQRAPQSPFTMVAAGSLDEANGILLMLEAFPMLKGEHWRLIIAGRGPLEQCVRDAAARDPRIEYRGYLDFDEVLDLYSSADVLLNIRLTKALATDYFFPSKMMEYMASGTLVITTCTGHVEEEFGEFCFLLRNETPKGLAKMIERVAAMDPQDRAAKGRQAREYMRANKLWDVQGREVLKYLCRHVLKIGEQSEV